MSRTKAVAFGSRVGAALCMFGGVGVHGALFSFPSPVVETDARMQ